MTDDNVIEVTTAPWTHEEVAALNAWQACAWVHPFTCGGNRGDAWHRYHATRTEARDRGVLVATPRGWRCPVIGCDYRQRWAPSLMLQGPPPNPLEGLAGFEDGSGGRI